MSVIHLSLRPKVMNWPKVTELVVKQVYICQTETHTFFILNIKNLTNPKLVTSVLYVLNNILGHTSGLNWNEHKCTVWTFSNFYPSRKIPQKLLFKNLRYFKKRSFRLVMPKPRWSSAVSDIINQKILENIIIYEWFVLFSLCEGFSS